MSVTRHGLLKATRCSRTYPSLTSTITPTSSTASITIQRRWASHGEHYNEPSGFLFNEMPRKDGSKRRREDWETIWIVGMGGSLVLAFGIFYFRPDTSISSWALEEAKKRMEARGDSAKYIPSPESRVQRE